MNRIIQSLPAFALLAFGFNAEIVSANTITLNTNLGFSATNTAGVQVTWNTRFVSGQVAVVRIVGNTETVFSAPAGVTLTREVIRPSENGTYGGVVATCDGGIQCAVVFTGANSATTIKQAGSDLVLSQLFENQTWVGGSANSLSAVTGSFASGTPSGSLASPPAGYGVSAGQAVRTSTSTIVVGGISNDGITGQAFASSDSIFSLLPSLTNNSAAFGISSNGLLAAGYDGTNSAIWNLALNTESLLFNNGGLFLSVLSGGAASGVDGNGYGTVFSPFFGNIMSTCAFVTASGGSVAPQYYDSGGNCLIERTLLSEYLNPSGTLFVNIAGQGSVIDFSQINAVNFNRPGWTNGGDVGGNVPEPSTFLLMGVGLETIRRMRKRRSA